MSCDTARRRCSPPADAHSSIAAREVWAIIVRKRYGRRGRGISTNHFCATEVPLDEGPARSSLARYEAVHRRNQQGTTVGSRLERNHNRSRGRADLGQAETRHGDHPRPSRPSGASSDSEAPRTISAHCPGAETWPAMKRLSVHDDTRSVERQEIHAQLNLIQDNETPRAFQHHLGGGQTGHVGGILEIEILGRRTSTSDCGVLRLSYPTGAGPIASTPLLPEITNARVTVRPIAWSRSMKVHILEYGVLLPVPCAIPSPRISWVGHREGRLYRFDWPKQTSLARVIPNSSALPGENSQTIDALGFQGGSVRTATGGMGRLLPCHPSGCIRARTVQPERQDVTDHRALAA